MFALALKDFRLLGKYTWFLGGLSFFLLFYYTNTLIGLAFSVLPALYLVSWSTSMDFRYKADSFVACLPVRPRSVVAARFLTIPMAWLAGFAAALVLWAIRSAFGAFIPAATLPGIAAVSLALALVSNGLYLAAYYLFGYQNARWSIFIFYGAIGAMGPIMNAALPGSAATGIPAVNAIVGGRAGPGLYAAVFAISLAAFAACFGVSLAAYRRKEF